MCPPKSFFCDTFFYVIENHGGYFSPVNVFMENTGKIRRSISYTRKYMAGQLGLETNTYRKMEQGYFTLIALSKSGIKGMPPLRKFQNRIGHQTCP